MQEKLATGLFECQPCASPIPPGRIYTAADAQVDFVLSYPYPYPYPYPYFYPYPYPYPYPFASPGDDHGQIHIYDAKRLMALVRP